MNHSIFAAVNSSLFPTPSSTTAEQVDNLFYFILLVSVFFFAIIVGVMVLFLIKYRARPGELAEKSPSHNNALELAWTVIPGIFVAGIFFWGFVGYLDMRQPPVDGGRTIYAGETTSRKRPI